jgi:hypothetical protein
MSIKSGVDFEFLKKVEAVLSDMKYVSDELEAFVKSHEEPDAKADIPGLIDAFTRALATIELYTSLGLLSRKRILLYNSLSFVESCMSLKLLRTEIGGSEGSKIVETLIKDCKEYCSSMLFDEQLIANGKLER